MRNRERTLKIGGRTKNRVNPMTRPIPLASGFKETPYWWEAAPRPARADTPLPREIDVAIVGSGLTGLNAARVLARAGRSVAVIDAADLGYGASTRNAGYVGRTLKHRFVTLERKLGLERAVAIYREMRAAYDAVFETVKTEGIDCKLTMYGRYVPAPSPAHYEDLAEEYGAQRRHLGVEFEMVPRAAQHRELGSDQYFGGVVIPDLAGLHPGLYHAGLLERAIQAGALMISHTPVTGIGVEGPNRFQVRTSRGNILARDVLVATNGYTDAASPWLRQRVIPFNAYMIATEPLASDVIDRILPNSRTVIEGNHDALFIRRSPDGRSILFGGLTGRRLEPMNVKAARLLPMLQAMVPDLAGARLAHAWTGKCSATLDMYPHFGRYDGIHYALGYCFAGVPMGTYLGRKAAQSILGSPEAKTVFAERPFRALPLYRGNPWFVPLVMRTYRWQDAWDARRSPRKQAA